MAEIGASSRRGATQRVEENESDFDGESSNRRYRCLSSLSTECHARGIIIHGDPCDACSNCFIYLFFFNEARPQEVISGICHTGDT